jgi:hypothetical protein
LNPLLNRLAITKIQLLETPGGPSEWVVIFPVGPDRSVFMSALDQGCISQQGIVNSLVDVTFLDQSGLLE